jgi:hypothetical protein
MNDEVHVQSAAAWRRHSSLNRIVQRAAPIDGSP